MKILHICVAGEYTDYWNYQENLLTKYHALNGHDVTIIASQWGFDEHGKTVKITETQYMNSVGVRVFRLPIKGEKDVHYRYKRFIGFYETIETINPDVIFVHNLQFFDVELIAKYAKNHTVKVYADNHADFSNSARSTLARIFYKTVWRRYANKLEPYITKFYGVLPARVDFLEDVYKLPKEKCELLVMGADDELVEKYMDSGSAKRTRERFGVNPDDFLIVTGGKIDSFKLQTLDLMEAVKRINDDHVKLIVFGSIQKDIQDKVDALCDGTKVQYIGWAKGEQSYEYFAAADLVVFPGRHSVYWEQVVAQCKPMICKYWDGTTHVDIGGNIELLYEDNVDEIKGKLEELLSDRTKYLEMLNAARSEEREKFLYSSISKLAIGE